MGCLTILRLPGPESEGESLRTPGSQLFPDSVTPVLPVTTAQSLPE